MNHGMMSAMDTHPITCNKLSFSVSAQWIFIR